MRETIRAVVVAGLAVLALAAAAATLDTTVVPEATNGDGSGGTPGAIPPPESGPGPGQSLPIPTDIIAMLLVLVLAVVVVLAIVQWRDTIPFVISGTILVVLFFLVMYVLMYFYDGSGFGGAPPGFNGSTFGTPGEGGEEAVETPETSLPPIAIFLVAGLALVGIVAALVSVRSSEEATTAEDEDAAAGPSAAAVGRAAGRAADRLEEDAAAANEVYRAWREMTSLLDVDNPDASTPGEFARAATGAGLGREDVSELTRLFEDVRYGDTQPSEELEEHSIELFRRIEDRYAEEEG